METFEEQKVSVVLQPDKKKWNLMRQKILEVAVEQFSRFGVRTVTMEDIARLSGVSKKTIYQEFKDKKELVKMAFGMLLNQDQEKLVGILSDGDGVIEHLIYTSKMIRERLGNMNPMAILEVQRYFPDSWEMFESFRDEIIVTDIVNVLERGKKLGYFREEINSEILARMRVNQISAAFDPSSFNNLASSLLDIHLEMMNHFLHGIFTEKGRQAYLEKYKSN